MSCSMWLVLGRWGRESGLDTGHGQHDKSPEAARLIGDGVPWCTVDLDFVSKRNVMQMVGSGIARADRRAHRLGP